MSSPLSSFNHNIHLLSTFHPMSIQKEIRLLDPSNPQHGHKLEFACEIRDILEYSHSRFYAALVAMSEEKSRTELAEMQKLLQQEVVSVAVMTMSDN